MNYNLKLGHVLMKNIYLKLKVFKAVYNLFNLSLVCLVTRSFFINFLKLIFPTFSSDV